MNVKKLKNLYKLLNYSMIRIESYQSIFHASCVETRDNCHTI